MWFRVRCTYWRYGLRTTNGTAPETEFMNVQLCWGFWAQSWGFSDFRVPYAMFSIQTSLKPLLLKGDRGIRQRWLWIARSVTLKTFVPITSKNTASGKIPSWISPEIWTDYIVYITNIHINERTILYIFISWSTAPFQVEIIKVFFEKTQLIAVTKRKLV